MNAIHDQNGNTSSKRIAMFLGLIYAMTVGMFGGFELIDPEFAMSLVKGFLTFSGGIGGISVAEFFKKGQ